MTSATSIRIHKNLHGLHETRKKRGFESRVDIPKVRSTRRSDAVALRVEVAADLHGVARLALVHVVVGRRLDEERVFAFTNTR